MVKGRPRKNPTEDNPIYKTSICFWCGVEFRYKVPQELAQKMRSTNFNQVFCDRDCERAHHGYVRQIEAMNDALSLERIHNFKKVCPLCGLIALHRTTVWCPRCKNVRLELTEVVENEIQES